MHSIDLLPAGAKSIKNAYLKIDEVFTRIKKQIEKYKDTLKEEVR
jgi:ribosome-associated translation inhibitor RaiA